MNDRSTVSSTISVPTGPGGSTRLLSVWGLLIPSLLVLSAAFRSVYAQSAGGTSAYGGAKLEF